MKHLAVYCVVATVISGIVPAEARDSEAAAKLQPRGAEGTGAEAKVSPPPAAQGAPQARSNLPPATATPGETPPPSATPPGLDPGQGARSSIQTSRDGFNFRVCNRSDARAFVALTRRDESGDGWRISGWFPVNPSSCEQIGTFARGWIYHYADASDGGSWSGSDVKVCVRYPGPFSRFDGGDGYTCRGDEKLKGFSGKFVEDNIGTYTWNLNP